MCLSYIAVTVAWIFFFSNLLSGQGGGFNDVLLHMNKMFVVDEYGVDSS